MRTSAHGQGMPPDWFYKWYKVPYVITEHASSINGNQTTPSQAVILKKAYSEARKIICVGTKLKRNLS